MPATTTAPPPKTRAYLITKANAQAMVAKSNAVQQRRRELLKATTAANSRARPPYLDATDFNSKRLARVRAQLDLIDSAIEREAIKHSPDGAKLNSLAMAQRRLSDEERILAGRPDGKRGARRDRPSGEAMLDLGQVSAPPPPAATEVSPAPVAPSAPSVQVTGDLPPG